MPRRHLPGLRYFRAFRDDPRQENAIWQIDKSAGLTDMERRVQHYEWCYNYHTRTIDQTCALARYPTGWKGLPRRCMRRTQNVSRRAKPIHRKRVRTGTMHCFSSAIATVLLGDDWTMDFRAASDKEKSQGSVPPIGTTIVQAPIITSASWHFYDWDNDDYAYGWEYPRDDA